MGPHKVVPRLREHARLFFLMSDDLTFNLVVSRLRNDISCDQIGLGPIWTTANDFFGKHGSNPWQKTSSSALALLISIKPLSFDIIASALGIMLLDVSSNDVIRPGKESG
jgi:hypothetical protein